MRDQRVFRRSIETSRYAAMWALLRGAALRRGIDARELARVRTFLRFRFRLDRPTSQDPFQRPRHLFPGLTARPWHEATDFGWTAELERAAGAIRAELVELLPGTAFDLRRSDLALQGAWTSLMLSSFGHPSRDHLARCPTTARVLESLPVSRTAGLTYFSALAPGTRLAAHCGPTNTRLRCHLGLIVPDGCGIRVGSTTRSWEEGRCIVFDDSFEHEVWNEGSRHRYVLILDFWHPELTPAEVWAVTQIERFSSYARRGRRRRASR